LNPGFHSDFEDTIVALATPAGVGAIGVIRLSGKKAIEIANSVFRGKDLTRQASHTIHFGRITDGEEIVDEVLISLFIGPKSYTREHVAEISTHGSPYIIQKIIRLLIQHGARVAKPGEFTKRAFLNGAFDLTQAEAVADLIHSDTEANHMAAMNQMRGGFSLKIKKLREELVNFASMIELELDFAEEDVEFADRTQLVKLIDTILSEVKRLINSFEVGNVIKNGVPTVIAGKPNSGKSTLLNTLLNEEKAIVSDIPGTTRDFIEDEIHIDSVSFRFIDTAGIREARDKIEAMGIKRTREKMKAASLIIYLVDLVEESPSNIKIEKDHLDSLGIPYLVVGNKLDKVSREQEAAIRLLYPDMIMISAASEENIETLKQALVKMTNIPSFRTGDTIVTNIRHFESLTLTQQALEEVLLGIKNKISSDLLAMNIRQALFHLGQITGEITTDDLLANIFSKFCIGK
jgi:tRNA modification GTPase